MKFNKTPLEGAFTIDLEKREDDRGFFGRFFCINEMREKGLTTQIVQINNSQSRYAGTLRGMHYQLSPKAETKIVRCIKGALWDVILDLRKESPTFGLWYGEELTAENRRVMYVPKGFAHGFISLTENTEAFYLVDEFYSLENERGIRWDDPKFKINWPRKPEVLSEKDSKWPFFDEVYHLGKK